MHNYDLLNTTNPEYFSSVRQILLKISLLKSKNNSSWEKELWTYSNINSQTKTSILKIQIPFKNSSSNFFQNLGYSLTHSLSIVPTGT